ncbi:MAG: transaldolase [Candidatus Solibacter sp.]|nr:transaldolase [Candidatus Solibacter sp.]
MQIAKQIPAPIRDLRVHIYADGADVRSLLELYRNPLIKGMTTNPTLMCKAGIADYERFAKEVLQEVVDKPISFEVFSDDFPEMRRQALKISAWQKNVYVKIPITNTRAESSVPLIRELSHEGVKVNVTAMLSVEQVRTVAEVLHPEVPAVASLFCGRIADTGRNPVPIICEALGELRALPKVELLWASVREVLNILQADESGVHIVTVGHEILAKALKLWAMDLDALSLDTVRMFGNDAEKAGYTL